MKPASAPQSKGRGTLRCEEQATRSSQRTLAHKSVLSASIALFDGPRLAASAMITQSWRAASDKRERGVRTSP